MSPLFAPACSSLTCAELADAYGEWPIDNTCTEQDSVDVCAESDAGIGQYSLLDPTRDKACLGGITDTDQGDDEVTDGWNHAATICSAIVTIRHGAGLPIVYTIVLDTAPAEGATFLTL